MNSSDQRTKRFIRNLKATRIISALLAAEQGLYGFFLTQQGSPEKTLYLFSSFLIAFLCFVSFIISMPKEKITGLGYPIFEMVPLALGMGVSLNRMFAIPGIIFSIPTLYFAVMYGGAVIFLLEYRQSGILYGTLAVLSIMLFNAHGTDSSVMPFHADFVVNNLLAWSISALNYRNYLQEQRNMDVIAAQNVQLRRLSEQDALTGLLNRRKIDNIIVELLEDDEVRSKNKAIILFDLDRFKLVNDTYGHQKGDALLKAISTLAKKRLQKGEFLARWGGEEFLVLTSRNGKTLAESLRKDIERSDFGEIGKITASFGVSVILPGDTEVKIFRQADQALYRAKELGRNRVEVFENP
ncbi:MAG: GGDEF domain-containing protein [Sphaerochaetaceae bacterium]